MQKGRESAVKECTVSRHFIDALVLSNFEDREETLAITVSEQILKKQQASRHKLKFDA